MDIDKIIAELELKNMLKKLLDTADYLRSAELADLADAQNWTKKNLSSFCSCVKVLLPPCSRICFWFSRPRKSGDVAKVDFYELKDGYTEIKILHAPDYDENEAEFTQSIQDHVFFHMLRRAIVYNLFFFPPESSTAAEHCPRDCGQHHDVSFIRLMLQLLGANT